MLSPTGNTPTVKQLKLGNKEHNKVFVCVVEVTRIKLEIVVEELRFCVVVGCYSLVQICNAQRITVEHHTQHTANLNGSTAC